jgi:hypothetical protein
LAALSRIQRLVHSKNGKATWLKPISRIRVSMSRLARPLVKPRTAGSDNNPRRPDHRWVLEWAIQSVSRSVYQSVSEMESRLAKLLEAVLPEEQWARMPNL